MFKLEDIKAGYLLKVKNPTTNKAFYMTVLPGSSHGHLGGNDGTLACCNADASEYWELTEFDNTLVAKGSTKFIVEAVYGYTYNRFLLSCLPEHRDLLWEREKGEPPKKMTVAEICEELGYDVEIVKE